MLLNQWDETVASEPLYTLWSVVGSMKYSIGFWPAEELLFAELQGNF